MEGMKMKKMIFAALAALALVACTKHVLDISSPEDTTPSQITFNLSATHPDGASTKAVKTGWENEDVIFVFFNNVPAPKYLKMSYDGTKWTTVEMNGDSAGSLGLAENATGTMRAVFLPFGKDATVSAAGDAFVFSTTYYSYYLTATLDYTVTDGTVSGSFDMRIPEGYVQFFIDKADAAPGDVIELRNKNLTPQGIASIAADGTITHTASATGAPLPGYVYGGGYLFSGILAEGARNVSKDYHFTLVAGGWDGSYYKKSYTGKTFYRGVSEGRALKLPVIGDWVPVTDYIPLDRGIDVRGKRVYWAQKNLGAASEKKAGDYYTWGDIEPYYTGDPQAETPAWKTGKESGYSWASYTRYTDDNGSTFKKYLGYIDSYTDAITLELMDDAANVLLGGDWRIPNMYEAMEGLKSQGNWGLEGENNVDLGHRISSRHAGYAASIFLPWQGYRTGTTLNYPFVHQGGSFWCSTRSNQVSMAHSFGFSLGGVDWSSYTYRNTGLPIRPVTD